MSAAEQLTPHVRELRGALASIWEAEDVISDQLEGLAESAPTEIAKSRLLVNAAFCRAHRSRLKTRIEARGTSLLPVVAAETQWSRAECAAFMRHLAVRYARLQETARTAADVSTAWVCELNGAEKLEIAKELESTP